MFVVTGEGRRVLVWPRRRASTPARPSAHTHVTLTGRLWRMTSGTSDVRYLSDSCASSHPIKHPQAMRTRGHTF